MQGKITHANLLGSGKWQTRTVGVILRSEVCLLYTSGTPHYKIKQMEQRPASEWVRVPDAHEALIARQDFDLVQRIKEMCIRDRERSFTMTQLT